HHLETKGNVGEDEIGHTSHSTAAIVILIRMTRFRVSLHHHHHFLQPPRIHHRLDPDLAELGIAFLLLHSRDPADAVDQVSPALVFVVEHHPIVHLHRTVKIFPRPIAHEHSTVALPDRDAIGIGGVDHPRLAG